MCVCVCVCVCVFVCVCVCECVYSSTDINTVLSCLLLLAGASQLVHRLFKGSDKDSHDPAPAGDSATCGRRHQLGGDTTCCEEVCQHTLPLLPGASQETQTCHGLCMSTLCMYTVVVVCVHTVNDEYVLAYMSVYKLCTREDFA